tara:strand:- start:520 stop:768 length:249 start_codon:yes stop_codon:yes gene_type:complete
MSLRDPFTGAIDFEEVARYAILIGIICAFASAGAASEGLSVLYPYEMLVDLMFNQYPSVTIASFMVMLMALWWYEQFQGGYY